RDEYDDKVSLNSDDERAATEQLKDLQYNYEKLKVQLEDKENEWAYKSENMTKDHEMIEEAYRQTISDYEIELSKLKSEMTIIEVSKYNLEKELHSEDKHNLLLDIENMKMQI